MSRRIRSLRGFTLVELMIVVAIAGILSAIAIPTFIKLVNRAKTGESVNNLNVMFKAASSYYSAERAGQGQTSTVSGYCIVSSGGPWPATPKKDKQAFSNNTDVTFKALGFSIADYVYYSYSAFSPAAAGGSCGHKAGETLYTFRAEGDLDGDLTFSLFELAAGSDNANNTLYHSVGFYVSNELE